MIIEIKDYGACNLSIAPVRAEPSDSSEIVTQLLFGDHVEILEKGEPWIKIRFAPDHYEGWMDFKQLSYLNKEQYNVIASGNITYLQDAILSLTGPRGNQNIILGSALPNIKDNHVILGNEVYTLNQQPNQGKPTLLESAMGYLNTPYLWGGKSIFGIDCSGLVQNVFKIHGVLLPRDASKQVNYGTDIAYENRRLGDVPFFINSEGKVHHVGILTEKNLIIHAAGSVRLDSFDEKGIFRKDLNKYTHHFHSIKRFD